MIQLGLVNELKDKLRDQALRDPLTGLHNRRYLEETLPRELKRAKRNGACLSVIMMNIDHFKTINDRITKFLKWKNQYIRNLQCREKSSTKKCFRKK